MARDGSKGKGSANLRLLRWRDGAWTALLASGQALSQPAQRPEYRALPFAVCFRGYSGKCWTRYPYAFSGSGTSGTEGSAVLLYAVSLPGFDKHPLHQNQKCCGLDLRKVEAPKGFSLHYVYMFYELMKKEMPEKAFFSRPQWFDLLMGTDQVRKAILAGKTETQIRATWKAELDNYLKRRARYLMY